MASGDVVVHTQCKQREFILVLLWEAVGLSMEGVDDSLVNFVFGSLD